MPVQKTGFFCVQVQRIPIQKYFFQRFSQIASLISCQRTNSGKILEKFSMFFTRILLIFAPSSGTILAFLLISTPIERNHSNRLSRNEGGHVLIDSIFTRYVVYCKERNWNVVLKNKMMSQAKSLIEQNFYVTESNDFSTITGCSRGYQGISMKLW